MHNVVLSDQLCEGILVGKENPQVTEKRSVAGEKFRRRFVLHLLGRQQATTRQRYAAPEKRGMRHRQRPLSEWVDHPRG